MMMLGSSFWQTASDLFFAPSLQLFLLIGSATLAIALLILTLTRWGHARPVMKCVILSIVAHILLLGYAYATKLIFEYPVAKQPQPINVQMIGYEVPDDPLPTPVESSAIQEFDRFVNEQPLPEVETLQRPGMDSQLVLARTYESELESVTDKMGALETEETPEVVEIVPPSIEIESENPMAFHESVVDAETIEFKRRGDLPPDVAEPDFKADPQIETGRPELPSAEFVRETPEQTFPDDRQRADQFESELIIPDADHPLVDQFLPKTQRTDHAGPAGQTAGAEGADRQMHLVSAPRRIGDGQEIPQLYKLRMMPNRAAIAVARGGSSDTEAAVQAALQWLAKTQKEDGRWDPRETGAGDERKVLGQDRGGCGTNADTGITGLATLAFLGAGQTHLEGENRVVVQKALEFLIRNQAADGSLAGNARLYARMYCHSMALLAISEALAVTGDKRLLDAVEKGVHYSVRAQNPVDGGWRYQPNDRGDMSQFGWQVMSLHSASIGGVQVSPQTIQRMHMFLDLCSSGQHQGLAAYRPGQGVSTTMTAEALLSRYFMKENVSQATVAEAQQRILQESPTESKINLYYWYYATMALYHSGGQAWDQWNVAMQKTLLPMQIQSGIDQGSWAPDGLWAGYGGRVYSTAMATLCLEVYYRYLPIFEANVSK